MLAENKRLNRLVTKTFHDLSSTHHKIMETTEHIVKTKLCLDMQAARLLKFKSEKNQDLVETEQKPE